MTGSFCLNLILKLYTILNTYYENSACYKIISKISEYAKNGPLCMALYNFVCKESDKKYSEGSFVFNVINKIVDTVIDFFIKIFGSLLKLDESSIICKYYSKFIFSLRKFGWAFKILVIALIVTPFVLSLFISLKYALVLVFGLVFIISAFYYLEICFSLFVFGMLVIPNDYWNNMYIFFAFIFYTGVYFIQILAGKRKKFNLKNLSIPLAFFILISIASLLITWSFSDSLRVLVIFLSCIFIAILIQGIISEKKHLDTFVSIIFIGIFLASMYGLYQYRMGIEVRSDYSDLTQSEGLRRLFSSMANPNNFAEVLVLLLPICFSHILNCKTDIKRLFYIILICPVLLALVLTYSRASYIAIVLVAGVYVLLRNKRLIPFFIIVGIACIPILPSSIMNRVLTIGKDSSSSFRLMIWNSSFELLMDNLISGIGAGPLTFANTYRNYADYRAANAMHSHNLLMQIWIEFGILGFISFIVYMFTTVKNCIAKSINTLDVEYKNYLIACVASIAGIISFGMVEHVWFYPRVLLTFWVVMGISMATVKLARGTKI